MLYKNIKVHSYRFEIITGPMSCGKTEELLRRLKRAKIANRSIKIFYSSIDTRSEESHIESRNGLRLSAIKVDNSAEILNLVSENDAIIGLDEVHFFDSGIIEVIQELVNAGKKVIAAGLDLDFKSEPFGPMAKLLCIADKVDKLTAICMKCGSEYGIRTQRLIEGKPVDKFSPQIMVGGDEKYEARCIHCYELFDPVKAIDSLTLAT